MKVSFENMPQRKKKAEESDRDEEKVPTCFVCKAENPTLQCKWGCEEVYFCSKEHLKAGWVNHKKQCKSYRGYNSFGQLGWLDRLRRVYVEEFPLEQKNYVLREHGYI